MADQSKPESVFAQLYALLQPGDHIVVQKIPNDTRPRLTIAIHRPGKGESRPPRELEFDTFTYSQHIHCDEVILARIAADVNRLEKDGHNGRFAVAPSSP